METITVRVFNIDEVDGLNDEEHIISGNCLYYDAVVNKVIEVIALYNSNVISTKLLMYEETLGGAAEMDLSFWDELKAAINANEVVLLDGDQNKIESLIGLPNKVILADLEGVQ